MISKHYELNSLFSKIKQRFLSSAHSSQVIIYLEYLDYDYLIYEYIEGVHSLYLAKEAVDKRKTFFKKTDYYYVSYDNYISIPSRFTQQQVLEEMISLKQKTKRFDESFFAAYVNRNVTLEPFMGNQRLKIKELEAELRKEKS